MSSQHLTDIESIRKRHGEDLAGSYDKCLHAIGAQAIADRGVLLSMLDAGRWQLSETAPRDGTAILGWQEEYGYRILYWAMGDYWAGVDGVYVPTHWMPLPEAP